MIRHADPAGRRFAALSRRAWLRWGIAVATVLAIHGAVVWLASNWRLAAATASAGEPPSAVLIDLSPTVAQTPPQDVAPGPQMAEAQPETTPEPQEAASPRSAAATDVEVPDLPRATEAAALLTRPPSKSEPPADAERRTTKLPKPLKPLKPRQEHKARREPARHAAPRTSAPPTMQARRADHAAAPTSGAASSAAAAASWKSELMAHLNRFKRFPPDAAHGGVATIAFTINRSGQVVSSRLLRSSGDSVLDAEAVSLPRRASPVPAPPTAGGSISLAVPIRFSR